MAELKPEELRRKIDVISLGVESSADIPPLEKMLGQERAEEALAVGLGVNQRGYNIFVCGLHIGGDGSEVIDLIRENMPQDSNNMLHDLAYVYNFQNPKEPKSLVLLPGQGVKLRDGISELVDSLHRRFTLALESEEFKEGIKKVNEKYAPAKREIINSIKEIAKNNPNIQISFHTIGPGNEEDEALNNSNGEKEKQLKDAHKSGKAEKKVDSREKRSRHTDDIFELDRLNRELQDLNKEGMQEIEEIRRGLCEVVVDELMQVLKNELYEGYEASSRLKSGVGRDSIKSADAFDDKVSELSKVHDALSTIQLETFLRNLKLDILANLDDFINDDGNGKKVAMIPGVGLIPLNEGEENNNNLKYKVNILVDNSGKSSPPIMYEAGPSFKNLFGSIELGFNPLSGERRTDFTKINPGAFHKAKGGYLILDVMDVLREPFAYEKLMQSLKSGKVTIEASPLSFLDTSLKPEPCDISDVKVIFVGEGIIYSILHQIDDDFAKLFKIRADIETDINIKDKKDNEDSVIRQYLGFVSKIRASNGLNHFNAQGLSAIVEHAMREAWDQEKLSVVRGDIEEIMIEANFLARRAGSVHVTDVHVEDAIESQLRRSRRYIERYNEMVEKGKYMVDTAGVKVGQINSLLISIIDDKMYGSAGRVTVVTSVGKKGVVHIERETHQSGSVHDKGVLTLEGYTQHVFGQDKRLAFNASITFEQMYSEVDGDSASSTELYALLSSLSGVPIKQGIAVTGSVNQFGEVQVIGAVNEKIEGFFELCRQSKEGLNGEQGVIIPYKNASELMLRRDVVEAVREGKFHIYAVRTIEEGIEILTGQKAGSINEEGTVYYKANKKLAEIARRLDESEDIMGEVGKLLEERLSGDASSHMDSDADDKFYKVLEKVVSAANSESDPSKKIVLFNKAISMIDADLKRNPYEVPMRLGKASILINLGKIYDETNERSLSKENYDNARSLLESIVRLDKDSLGANLQLGIVHTALGEHSTAIDYINKVIENDNTQVEAYKLRVSLNGKLGKYEEALADAERLIKLEQSHDADLYIQMGTFNVKLAESSDDEAARRDRFEEAVKCWENSSAAAPDYVMPIHNRARVFHYGLKDYNKAAACYKAVVTLVDMRLEEEKKSDKERKGAEQSGEEERETLKDVLRDGIVAAESFFFLGHEQRGDLSTYLDKGREYASIALERELLTPEEIDNARNQAGINPFSK